MKVKNNTQSKEALVDTPIPSRYAEQLRNKKGEWYFPGGILTYESKAGASKLLKLYGIAPDSFKSAIGKSIRIVRFDPVIVDEIEF